MDDENFVVGGDGFRIHIAKMPHSIRHHATNHPTSREFTFGNGIIPENKIQITPRVMEYTVLRSHKGMIDWRDNFADVQPTATICVSAKFLMDALRNINDHDRDGVLIRIWKPGQPILIEGERGSALIMPRLRDDIPAYEKP